MESFSAQNIGTSAVPKTPQKKTKMENSEHDKLRCQFHKREKILFHCVDEEINICALCIPTHKSHNLFNLKEKCQLLYKPWSDIKNQASRYKSKFESVPEDWIPASELKTFNQNYENLNTRVEEMQNFKKNFQFNELDAASLHQNKYKEKTQGYGKLIVDKYIEPREKGLMVEEEKNEEEEQKNQQKKQKKVTFEGDQFERLKEKNEKFKSHLRKLKNNFNEKLQTIFDLVSEMNSKILRLESLTVQTNQRNKQLSDELSQLYDYINSNGQNGNGTQKTLSQRSQQNVNLNEIDKKRDQKNEEKQIKKENKVNQELNENQSSLNKKEKKSHKIISVSSSDSEEEEGPSMKLNIAGSISQSSLSD